MQGQASVDTLEVVDTITSGSHQLAHSDDVHPSFLLGVRVLHHGYLGIGLQARNLGQLDEVVDTLAVELQMETSVLECARQLNNRLTDILDLLLAGNLARRT